MIPFTYNAKLDRVVDGDTIDAHIDLGFNITIFKRIRLEGIDAPETRTRDLEEKEAGLMTKARLEALLGPPGSPFVLISNSVGKYGRVLGTIYVDDLDINKLLLSEGLAEVYK